MSVNIRFPNITEGTPDQQISQIRSYLHQLVEQLNWAFESEQSVTVQGSGDLTQEAYLQIRAMIIRYIDEVDASLGKYVTGSELNRALEGYVSETELERSLTALDGKYAPLEAFNQLVQAQWTAGDYITEASDAQTDFGTWHSEKLKSGRCCLSGLFTVIPTASELRTAWYRSNSFAIPLPYGIENAVVTATAKGCCFVESEWISMVDGICAISFRLVSDAEFPADTAIEVSLSVTGNSITLLGGDTNGES